MSSPSPLLPNPPRRRLSARRGSISAPDPFAKHADLNRSLSSSSTLTIVKVVNNNPDTVALQDPPASPGIVQRRQQHQHQHRRIGSNSSDNGNSGRLSFAFSSFGGPSKSSPPTSPRIRPSSPIRNHSLPQSKPRLTPDQLYDLAHQATNPKYFPPSPAVNDASSPYRPESPHHRPSSPSYFRRSPVLHAVNVNTAPATFTPLPPSVFLPFMDRPAEVAGLITSAPTKKLFALLRQTFPRDPSSPNTSSPTDPLSSPQLPPTQPLSQLPGDSTRWTYNDLILFLTTASRSDMPDTLWVAKIRKCILSRSELIWERVKGALGVPPELDIDANFLGDAELHGDVFESSESEGEEDPVLKTARRSRPAHVRTETDDMEDHGMKARGHWDDWDMVLSSPEVEKTKESVGMRKPVVEDEVDTEGTTTIAPTPRQVTPPESIEIPVITQEIPTPSQDAFERSDKKDHSKSRSSISLNPADFGLPISSSPILSPTEGDSDSQLIIEPLMSPSASNSAVQSLYPPPLSLPSNLALESPGGGLGLGDIMEGEEEEENEEKEDTPTQSKDAETKDTGKESIIDPCQIHGIRISLPGTPVTPTSNWREALYNSTFQPQSSSSSPIEITGGSINRRPLSVGAPSPNVFSPGAGAGLTRSGSSGSVKSLGSVGGGSSARKHSYWSPHHTPGSDGGYESDGVAYDPVGDRAPGNPLFPSNFARLATGPTLAANNPALRSPLMPPPSKYHPLLHSSSLRGRFNRRGSRGSVASASDYAITFGSGSVNGEN
ncbi:hypothetical protein K435DRAFT_205410 [Dendrothele bispora CBS 962.96]|uniref:Uncharacterized protein n=1 Tax=Dendrothele bispora (strain CBS 962.96) TaxID=1314807 RepID=A0A4S8LTQ0_DENBC|nr:hypothetical protein K435DRAFT_205410 [Dendrothele bispora CBS 962.96]